MCFFLWLSRQWFWLFFFFHTSLMMGAFLTGCVLDFGGCLNNDKNTQRNPNVLCFSFSTIVHWTCCLIVLWFRVKSNMKAFCRSCAKTFEIDKFLVESIIEKSPNNGWIHPRQDVNILEDKDTT